MNKNEENCYLPWDRKNPVSKEKYEMCVNLLKHDYSQDLIEQLINKRFPKTDDEIFEEAFEELKTHISKALFIPKDYLF